MPTHMSKSVQFISLGLCTCVVALPVVASIVYFVYGQQKIVGGGGQSRADLIHSKKKEVGRTTLAVTLSMFTKIRSF